jgi:hypothetical protein
MAGDAPTRKWKRVGTNMVLAQQFQGDVVLWFFTCRKFGDPHGACYQNVISL